MEVRRKAGQPVNPDDQRDEDLKLLAINCRAELRPRKAIPILEKLLQGPSSPKLRSKAVFVLAQSNSPKARRDPEETSHAAPPAPELQSQAIQYLGVMGGPESRAILAEVYTSSTDVDVKRRILRAFMVSGEKQRLLDGGADRAERGPAIGSGAAARRDGRTRRALAALSEGIDGRGQEADPPGDVRRRQLDAPDRAAQVREGSRAARHRRAEPRADGRSADWRGAGRDLQHRQGSGGEEERDQCALHSRQRDGARRARAQRKRRRDEEVHRAEAVGDGRQGGHRLHARESSTSRGSDHDWPTFHSRRLPRNPVPGHGCERAAASHSRTAR